MADAAVADKPATIPAGGRTVSPIMIYPPTDEMRESIVQAAKDEGLKMSPFFIFLFKQYQKNK